MAKLEHESKIEKLNEAGQWAAWKLHVKIPLIAAEVYEIVTGDESCPIEETHQTILIKIISIIVMAVKVITFIAEIVTGIPTVTHEVLLTIEVMAVIGMATISIVVTIDLMTDMIGTILIT